MTDESQSRPPAWLIVITAAMAAILLAMAVGETSLSGQYLIDQGEYLSLVGLAFILIAGVYLHRQHRLAVSMPLVFPWLIYPVITQGDQIIDNLSINAMRWICHVLLAAIFAMPVAVIVLAARYSIAREAGRRPVAMLTAGLLMIEMILADLFLGTLMIITLIVMIVAVLLFGSREPRAEPIDRAAGRRRGERLALVTVVAGVVVSGALYLGFKNRPGVYQGSPSFFMDATQQGGRYPLDQIALPANAPAAPGDGAAVKSALVAYATTLDRLLAGYYILDRNYTHDFHNELFMRSTPLLPNYRAAGLAVVDEARALRLSAEALAANARGPLADTDPLAALLDEMRAYVAYNFTRAGTIEAMSAEFERTKAGLQHAAHIYEGEGKFLGVTLNELLDKHHAVLTAPAVEPVTRDFTAASRAIHDAYANRIVGF